MIKHVNESEFQNEVIKNEKVVLVDFYATWCPPCKMLAPVLEQIANSRAEFDIAKVNVDENPGVSSSFRIEVVPTMLVFKNGKVVDKAEGFMSMENIVQMVTKHI